MRHLHSQRQVPSQTPVQKTRIQKATAQRRKVFSCFIRPNTHTNLTWKRYKPSQGWKKQEREQPRPQHWSISIDKVGLTLLMNGKPLSIPIVAANVVLPLQASKKHVTVYMLLLMLKLKIIPTYSDCMKQVKQAEMPLHIWIFATCSLWKMKEGENTFEAWFCPWCFKHFLSKSTSTELIATALSMELLQPLTMHWEDCTQEKICTCHQVLQGGKWAEVFSHFEWYLLHKSHDCSLNMCMSLSTIQHPIQSVMPKLNE